MISADIGIEDFATAAVHYVLCGILALPISIPIWIGVEQVLHRFAGT